MKEAVARAVSGDQQNDGDDGVSSGHGDYNEVDSGGGDNCGDTCTYASDSNDGDAYVVRLRRNLSNYSLMQRSLET